MSKKTKYKSDTFESIRASAKTLFKVGAIDKMTMRKFDESCIAEVHEYTLSEIKHIREKNKVSQPVFAHYLNTSPSTVEKWEAGKKQPSRMARRLLSIVEKHGLQVFA